MKMLIIDDCELIQNRLSKSIAKIDEKIRISQANSCLEAIKTFADFNPDTVILDISLPDGSGIDLLKKFKMEKPGTKVFMFTNYPSDEFKKRCNDLGADYFFDKSNFLGLINIVINRVLGAGVS